MKDIDWESLPQALCWSEGMMLSPQHFQQNDVYWESQLQVLRKLVSPHAWGLTLLDIDHGKLMQGEVVVRRVRAILQDGLVVNYQENEHDRLQLDLTTLSGIDQLTRVRIHLVAPIRTPGCVSDSATIQRFEAVDGPPSVDDNTGQGEIVTQRLSPKLALQATDRVSSKYASVPLFEVCQPDVGNFQLGEYCPALLNIAAESFVFDQNTIGTRKPIQQRCQALALSIRNKARQLAGYSEQGEDRLGHKIGQLHRSWIRALSRNLPEFELASDDQQTHPHTLYMLLARMVGIFSELDPVGVPPKLAAYQHSNSLSGFNQALDYLQQQLSNVNMRFTSIHFEQNRKGVFTLQYDKAWAGGELLVELSAFDGGSTEELSEWFKACRIASFKMHESLAKHRMLGASVRQVSVDEQTGIAAGPGRALFAIQADEKLILPGQQLVIVCTSGQLKLQQPRRITLHVPHELRV
ncbi:MULTISPECIES: type VI secretion system baseplate subunit TssK [unclassified Agarivorans]|uniref:type VI secretion system baseplate subunit TssK n=1 Tax=unclassified Agarivorans TaxID=2636026 RepID=UPI003D7D67F8